MKKTISSNELHGMIAKCVGEVLAESRQKQTPRNTQKRVLTESQLQSYIQNVINEEMENELFDKTSGKLGFLWNKGKEGAQQLVKSGQEKIDNIRTGFQNFGDNVEKKFNGIKDKANTFVQNMNQAGNNASFVADTQKLSQNINMFYEKYKGSLGEFQDRAFREVIKVMNKMVTDCQNGNFQAM